MKFHNIDIPEDRIADFCQRWKVVELALFGSVLRDDFGPDSDIDVLYYFYP
ncbi:MAG: nucleotidyltransferase domain-containing protein [Sedimentisphaerales bacterium]